MAEALGLASGVIAVLDMATKVGGAGIKLKRLWDEVNEVPSVLLEKAEQVQIWDEMFDQAERQLVAQTLPALAKNKALLQKSLVKARALLAELQVMIDGFLEQSTIGRRYKRKIGSSKVVLRKTEIKALNEKLDEALTQFQMAQSLCMMATLMQFPILAIESQPPHTSEPDRNQSTSGSPKAHSDSGDETADNRLSHTASEPKGICLVSSRRTVVGRAQITLGSRGGFQFSLRTPDWLSSSVYAFMALKSISGWDLHLRAYEVVPSFDTTDLIHHFENDDSLAIFKFLDENKMTPHVRDMEGQGLLHLACQHSSVNFMSLLLKRGIKLSISEKDTEASAYDGSIWLWFLLMKGFEAHASLNRDSPFPGQKVLQILRSHDMDENAFDPPPHGGFTSSYSLPPNILSNLMDDEYYRIPVKDRLEDARHAWPVTDFEPFLSWLPELKQDPCKLLQISREPGMLSFIHTIASNLPSANHRLQHNRYLSITHHPWFKPLCKCISADPEGIVYVENWIHPFAGHYHSGRTPFSLIVNSIRGTLLFYYHACTQEPVQLWVTALFSCGIELLTYGRYEEATYRRQAVKYHTRGSNDIRSRKATVKFTLIGITYGSHPEHWKLWFVFEYEDYAGDFWSMVEQSSTEDPDLNIPGSWVEEPKDPRTVERERLREWDNEELPPLIWSEYRKIRPPM